MATSPMTTIHPREVPGKTPGALAAAKEQPESGFADILSRLGAPAEAQRPKAQEAKAQGATAQDAKAPVTKAQGATAQEPTSPEATSKEPEGTGNGTEDENAVQDAETSSQENTAAQAAISAVNLLSLLGATASAATVPVVIEDAAARPAMFPGSGWRAHDGGSSGGRGSAAGSETGAAEGGGAFAAPVRVMPPAELLSQGLSAFGAVGQPGSQQRSGSPSGGPEGAAAQGALAGAAFKGESAGSSSSPNGNEPVATQGNAQPTASPATLLNEPAGLQGLFEGSPEEQPGESAGERPTLPTIQQVALEGVKTAPIEGRSPTQTPPSVPGEPGPLIEQMVRGVRMVLQRDGGSVRIHLDPPDLGSVRIRLEVSEDRVRGWMEASSRSTQSLLEQSLPQLRRALESQGIQLESFSIRPDSGAQSEGSQRFSSAAADAGENGRGGGAESGLEAMREPEGIEGRDPIGLSRWSDRPWGWNFLA